MSRDSTERSELRVDTNWLTYLSPGKIGAQSTFP